MSNKRVLSVTFIILCLVLVFGIEYFKDDKAKKNQATYEELLPATDEENPNLYLDDNFVADENFSSNLPLLIIDMAGEEPPVTSYYDFTANRHIILNDIEPYIEGEMSIINSSDSINSLSDNAVSMSQIKIKRRGNSSMLYEKPQYLIKLVTESGEENELSLLGMGEEDEWILNGSMTDKSLMRNYLGFKISSQIMEYTPDNEYCEVFIKEEGEYIYQGVYLLGENIKQGENRIDIADYKSSESYSSYIIKRDRYDETALLLDTYATKNNLTGGYLELLYPNKSRATDEIISYIEQEISSFEKILYSDDPMVFSTYTQYIDVDSFVDYFIINEFLGNYDAGENSTYLYKDIKGKLKIGPVWDFDGSIDNFLLQAMDVEKLAFYKTNWFDRLTKDEAFVKKVEERFVELRKGVLSQKNVENSIDEVDAYLKNARQREWMRWSYDLYSEYDLYSYIDDSGDIIYRNSDNYEQEVYKIKTVLRKHGNSIQKELKNLEKDTEFNTNYSNNKFVLLILCIFIFIAPIIYVTKYFK